MSLGSIVSSANGRKPMPPSLTRPVWPAGQALPAMRTLPEQLLKRAVDKLEERRRLTQDFRAQ